MSILSQKFHIGRVLNGKNEQKKKLYFSPEHEKPKKKKEEEKLFVLCNKSQFQADSNSHDTGSLQYSTSSVRHGRKWRMKKKKCIIGERKTCVKCNAMM